MEGHPNVRLSLNIKPGCYDKKNTPALVIVLPVGKRKPRPKAMTNDAVISRLNEDYIPVGTR